MSLPNDKLSRSADTNAARETGSQAQSTSDEQASESSAIGSSARLIALTSNWEFFHDGRGDPYVGIPADGHVEVYRLHSRRVRAQLRALAYSRNGRPPSVNAVEDALGVLEARAQFDGPQEAVSVRVAAVGYSHVYVDLGTPTWQVVEITAGGWQILDKSPVRFRRTATSRQLAMPRRDGSLNDLFELINVRDRQHRALALGWMVGCFHPLGPYPLLVIGGEQGSAKTSACRTILGLLDPCEPMLRAAPREERDLMIAAQNGHVLGFDNISGISGPLSDALCRLSTGGGLATRKLYTDDEEAVLEAKRPVIINGIDAAGARPDLVDRSIIVTLPPLEVVLEERVLNERFQELAPGILGSLFDAVANAIGRLHEIRLDRAPRMADFANWVVASETALPLEPGEFLASFLECRRDAAESAIALDSLAGAIRALAAREGRWVGTFSALLKELRSHALESEMHEREWPANPKGLATALRRLAPGLRTVGVIVVFDLPRTAGGRVVEIRAPG